MGLTDREREWGIKASRFLKAELKRAGIGYKELRFFADRAAKKWPLRGSLKLG